MGSFKTGRMRQVHEKDPLVTTKESENGPIHFWIFDQLLEEVHWSEEYK